MHGCNSGDQFLNVVGHLYMHGENDVSVVARRLMDMVQGFPPSAQGGGSFSNTSLRLSDADLEVVVVGLLLLLDRSPERGSKTVADAILMAANAGQSLLHLGAALGFERLLKELLRCNIDHDLQDANGFTALHFAALYGHLGCAQLLAYEGADTDIVDIWGRTAQQVALDSDHYEVADFVKAFNIIANIGKLWGAGHDVTPGGVEVEHALWDASVMSMLNRKNIASMLVSLPTHLA